MTDDEIDDRLSKRFGDESDGDDPDEDDTDMSSQPEKNAQISQNAQKAKNIKKEWNVRSVYLSDDLNDELTTAFKQLDLDLDGTETEINLKKTRHFYPLVVELGLERLEELEVTEVIERLEE